MKTPSVTTVLRIIGGDKVDAFKRAAFNAAKNGNKDEDFDSYQNKIFGIGTLTHNLCEAFIKDEEAIIDPKFSENEVGIAQNCADKFKKFWLERGFTIEAVEKQFHSELGYTGKIDILAIDSDGRRCLIDIKTGNKIYEDVWYQLAAYKEMIPGNIDSCIVIRLGKDNDEIEIEERDDDMGRETDIFFAALKLWNLINNN